MDLRGIHIPLSERDIAKLAAGEDITKEDAFHDARVCIFPEAWHFPKAPGFAAGYHGRVHVSTVTSPPVYTVTLYISHSPLQSKIGLRAVIAEEPTIYCPDSVDTWDFIRLVPQKAQKEPPVL